MKEAKDPRRTSAERADSVFLMSENDDKKTGAMHPRFQRYCYKIRRPTKLASHLSFLLGLPPVSRPPPALGKRAATLTG